MRIARWLLALVPLGLACACWARAEIIRNDDNPALDGTVQGLAELVYKTIAVGFSGLAIYLLLTRKPLRDLNPPLAAQFQPEVVGSIQAEQPPLFD